MDRRIFAKIMPSIEADAMLSKTRLSHLRTLRQKKGRSEQDLFIAEGDKLVAELLGSSFRVKTVYATENWLRRNNAAAAAAEETISITEDDMGRISSLVTPQEVLAVVGIPSHRLEPSQLRDEFTLVLDGIRDPGNMGTIIRIADWFGIRNLVCSPDSAEIWNPKVVQASMGSVIRVKVHEMELESFFRALNQADGDASAHVPVYGTFLEGKSIYNTTFSGKGVLVIGNEASGIRAETEKFITQKITIPSFANPGPESLNAAVATAIACSEIRRNSALPGGQPAA
jgi:RNA methyltransferase, TrmH family